MNYIIYNPVTKQNEIQYGVYATDAIMRCTQATIDREENSWSIIAQVFDLFDGFRVVGCFPQGNAFPKQEECPFQSADWY